MKKNHRILTLAASLAVFAALLVSCVFTVEKIVLPDTIKSDSTIEINTRISFFHVQSDENSRLVFGILVPKEWKAASNTTITFSTEGRPDGQQGQPEIVNAKMHVVDPSATDPTTGQTWSAAFQSMYGSCGNYGLTEWVVFESDEVYVVNWGENKTWYADVKIKIKTGSASDKFFFANAFCGTTYGFGVDGSDHKYSNALVTVLESEGGVGRNDYTVPALVSTTPMTFSYEDIISINFVSKVGDSSTELYGVDKVYLQGVATLASGKEVKMTAKTDMSLMKKTSDVDYYKYIYPRQFFGVSDSEEITMIKVWFEDATGAKVQDNDGYLHEIKQNGTLLK